MVTQSFAEQGKCKVETAE